ncbi:hypothetical protein [Rhodospirillum sp. A1_3_36]|uniref:hypothetical protein n=1 Tax=Rhodospirillum sp. A1_3_36 TaxID=3391666 RepID=UPI0039A44CBE
MTSKHTSAIPAQRTAWERDPLTLDLRVRSLPALLDVLFQAMSALVLLLPWPNLALKAL